MKLKWTHDRVTGERRSGNYVVWLQSRLLNGELEWGAKIDTPDGTGEDQQGGSTWLTETAYGVREAKEVCQEHADRVALDEESKHTLQMRRNSGGGPKWLGWECSCGASGGWPGIRTSQVESAHRRHVQEAAAE